MGQMLLDKSGGALLAQSSGHHVIGNRTRRDVPKLKTDFVVCATLRRLVLPDSVIDARKKRNPNKVPYLPNTPSITGGLQAKSPQQSTADLLLGVYSLARINLCEERPLEYTLFFHGSTHYIVPSDPSTGHTLRTSLIQSLRTSESSSMSASSECESYWDLRAYARTTFMNNHRPREMISEIACRRYIGAKDKRVAKSRRGGVEGKSSD
ncbi:hypothetical protein IW261DRAFT_1596769 [Armillaria novae-zelandiae]|uniref:Uncharacterized protein n=1 Tax=Armillaria novae-zelandiae TaxID=153914 RepID=A0AA39NVG0_9AGAR|nr:hypothetical protein IW261DRAFT_1596769 [Armillaria novae-zelandiae]